MGCMCCGTSTDPLSWQDAFGTSWCLSHRRLLVLRILFCICFVAHFIVHLYVQLVVHCERFHYVTPVTRWVLIIQVIYFCLLVYTTLLAQGSSGSNKPKVTNVTMILFAISHPASLTVTVLFWLLVEPIQNLCSFTGKHDCYQPEYLHVFVHGLSAFFCLVSFLVGRIPFYFVNSGWFMTFGLSYVMWTVIHYFCRIGAPSPCDALDLGYEQAECPLYSFIDWHPDRRDRSMVVTSAILFGALPCVVGIYRLLGFLRDLCSNTSCSTEAACEN